jgi:organic radical activating enzyme
MISSAKTANISNIFSSIQGEGAYLGYPQIFLRFTGCNLRCRYCDTPDSLYPQALAKIEQTPFSNESKLVSNPLSAETIIDAVAHLKGKYNCFHSIVLTGGEPLVHFPFLQDFLPALKKLSLPIFLETNGTLPKNLEKVLPFIDIVSIDIKNPSDLIKGTFSLEETESFINISLKKECYVKIVVTSSVGCPSPDLSFFSSVVEMLKKVNASLPIIIQPEFSYSAYYLNGSLLFKVYELFNSSLEKVRIIPQVHKLACWR